MRVFTILLGIMMTLLFVTPFVLVMKVICLIVIYRLVRIITNTVIVEQSLLDAVRSIFNVSKMTSYVYIFYSLDTQSITSTHPTSTSVTGDSDSSSSSNDDNNHVDPGVIAGGLLVFIFAGIVIIGIIIIVIRKKKSTRLSQQNARGVVATPPQASVVQYTYPSPYNPSYSNPTYAQPQISTGEEATLSEVPQSAAHYPFHHDTEHAAVGSTSNPSALPNDEVNPPPYEVVCAPDGYTNNQSTSHDGILTLSPPDYASVVSAGVSVPVPPVNNI